MNKNIRLKSVWTVLVLLSLILIVSGCGKPEGEEANEGTQRNVSGELPAIDADGVKKIVRDSKGKVLVVDYWATWCVPCVEMFPKIHQGLQPLVEQGKVRLVTITFDADTEPYITRAKNFLEKNHALKDAYIAPTSPIQESIVDAMGENWKDIVVPAILIYDKQGNLAAEFLTGGVDEEVIQTAKQLADSPF